MRKYTRQQHDSGGAAAPGEDAVIKAFAEAEGEQAELPHRRRFEFGLGDPLETVNETLDPDRTELHRLFLRVLYDWFDVTVHHLKRTKADCYSSEQCYNALQGAAAEGGGRGGT